MITDYSIDNFNKKYKLNFNFKKIYNENIRNKWNEYKTNNITNAVEKIANHIKLINPDIKNICLYIYVYLWREKYLLPRCK